MILNIYLYNYYYEKLLIYLTFEQNKILNLLMKIVLFKFFYIKNNNLIFK